jgi:hypothetical protein
VVALVAVFGAIAIRIILIAIDHTIRYPISRVWNEVTDAFDFSLGLFSGAGSILAAWGNGIAGFASAGFVRLSYSFDNDVLPTLHSVGTLPDGPTIQWTIQDSLVAATEATQKGVQDLLRRCAMSETPDLELDASTTISCQALNRQLDSPPLMTKVRRQSTKLHETISDELAREFKGFVQFLHLLRDSPASAALNPRIPRSGFASSWQSIQHRLDVVYRTVWCRWLRRQPASTLDHPKSQLLALLRAGLQRREGWKTIFSDLKRQMTDKYTWSCPKGGCKDIEDAARRLGPASLSPSSLFEVLSPPQGGAGRWSSAKNSASGKEQGQREQPSKSDEKALIEQRERSFELQKLAAKCVAKCTLLQEHQVELNGIVIWLEAEIKWWTEFRNHHANSLSSLIAEKFDMSLLADIHRLEDGLDKAARAAMGRKGPQ